MEEPEEMLTVVQAAKELGVTPGAVRLAIYDKRLPSEEFYGRRLIKRPDLETYRLRTQPDGAKRIGRPPGPRIKETKKPPLE